MKRSIAAVLTHPAAGVLVLVLAIACLVPGLGGPGLWEPQEMAVADEAASRADHTYKALPPIGECGKAPDAHGARTLTPRAAAWGLKNIDGSDRGVRVPFVLLGLLGALATFGIGWRLASPRAGLLSGVIVCSFPLWGLQSRQLTTDIGTATGAALIAYGLCALARQRERRDAWRAVDVLVSCAALVAGADLAFQGGGVLLGVIPPLAGVAVAGAFGLPLVWQALVAAWTSIDRRRIYQPYAAPDPWASAAALVAGAAFLVTTGWLVHQIFHLAPLTVGSRQVGGRSILVDDCWSSALGGQWRADDDLRAGYDSLFEQIGFGMFPWSIMVPLALGALASGLAGERRRFAGGVLLAWAAAAWFAAAIMARKVGFAIFPGFPACAAGVGVWLDAVLEEREAIVAGTGDVAAHRARAWSLIGLAMLLGVVVLAKDMQAFPERITSLLVGSDLVKYPQNARFLFLPMKVWLVFLGIAVALPFALDLWLWRPPHPRHKADGLVEYLGLDLIAPLGIPLSLAATVATALFWTHGWHRGLSDNLSSKHIFQTYRDLRRPGDALGIMGTMGNAPRYYADAKPEVLGGRDQLMQFLKRPGRVFAMAPAAELCAIHQASSGGVHDYVIDDTNATTLLLSNQLTGASDHNPLRKAIVREPPKKMTPFPGVHPVWDNSIELVGTILPKQVDRGSTMELTLVFQVKAQITGTWKIFAHFDFGGSRFQGDHDPIRGRCATSSWQVGDYIIDTFRVDAGNASFAPGRYDVWIGFFTGSNPNWRNMTVTTGDKDANNRVKVGQVYVRGGGGGCGCRSADPGASAAGAALALLVAAGLSRRRRRPA